MSQTWTDDVYAAGHVGQTDLQNMENNFAALKSLFSGAAQPASMAACHPWFDTTQHVLKVRDDGDAAWIGLMHGDVSQKIWIYRNAAMSGWAIDSGVSDKVLGLKGGATYTTGAATAGTWTQPNHKHAGGTLEHKHDLPITLDSNNTVGIDDVTHEAGGACNRDYASGFGGAAAGTHRLQSLGVNSWSGETADGAGANTYRPAAAVGTLQYLDL